MKIKIDINDLNPKFKIGQSVYVWLDGKAIESKIRKYKLSSHFTKNNNEVEIFVDEYYIEGSTFIFPLREDEVFSSKKECEDVNAFDVF